PTDAPTDAPTDEPTEPPQPIKIANSLVGIAGLATNPVVGDPGTAFLIEGGVGDIGPDTIDSLNLNFADDLDVTLQVLEQDAGQDAVVDGTIQLNTSLAGIAGLGIDQITGAAGLNVAVTGGVGDQTAFGGLDGIPQFDQGLNVTQHVVAGDAALDGFVDGTIQLNTSLAGVAGLGIDAVTGADGLNVAVMGGVGVASLANLESLSTGFASGLNVTQHVTQADVAALGGLGGMASTLAGKGVDTLSVGEATLGLGDVSALLDAGLNFAASDNISFVADVAGTALASNGIDLDDLGNLGVDSVDVNVGTADTIGIDANTGMGSAGMDAESLGNALADLVEKFQGQVFATEDEVTLHVGEGNAVAGLDASLLEDIRLLGIDFLSGSDSLDLNDLNKA
ncbi:MAG: hypothetical protein PHW78_02650, partial [Macromonas bipunctata]|nr:hypothetical protein [Macromonas bipunctata]